MLEFVVDSVVVGRKKVFVAEVEWGSTDILGHLFEHLPEHLVDLKREF